ncbi:hypothetical protein HJA_07737 [Hyphomonas jannaschiana VP2]|uniref:Uncharacterized protein n=1 Tax=Hyphomonas jannaschiana VP2 TaxID=1280952 RepID=A0A059FF55_9PROT|nr:hypothetical protein HJA_07737 [Hyphomonas jannaschiana VP2]
MFSVLMGLSGLIVEVSAATSVSGAGVQAIKIMPALADAKIALIICATLQDLRGRASGRWDR